MVAPAPYPKPTSLAEWQAMIWSIYKEKDHRDYTRQDLLLHVVEETANISEGLRKEAVPEILEKIPRLFIWFLAFCSMAYIDVEQVVWRKYHGCCPYCGATKHCFCIAQEAKPEIWHRDDKATIPGSLSSWQRMFDEIYGRLNRITGRDKVWMHFLEELGETSRAFRLSLHPNDSQELLGEIADMFAWLCSFCNRLKVDLGELAFACYPGVCDTCRQPKCACPKV